MVNKNRSWRGGLAALALATPVANAGHPMLSEDTGTQGRRNAELELGYAWSRQSPTSVFLFQPQLSYGTSSRFDLILQPSWTVVDTPDAGREKGLGDTNLDFKWRHNRGGLAAKPDQQRSGQLHQPTLDFNSRPRSTSRMSLPAVSNTVIEV